MANKQQTAVETLIEQLLEIRDSIGMNTKQNRFARGRVVDCIIKAREALQMEREQIDKAFDEGQEYEYQYHVNGTPKFDSGTYFIETYAD